MSRLILTSPRDREAGLANLNGPEDSDLSRANLLVLKPAKGGAELVAEKNPDGSTFSTIFPAMKKGEDQQYEVTVPDEVAPAGAFSWDDAPVKLDLHYQNKPFATFHYGSQYPKPVWNPILTPGGHNMLREPMGAYTQGEHPWQRGLTLMQGALNGVDAWNEEDTPKHGRTEQDKMAIVHAPLSIMVQSENTWYAQQTPLLTDTRYYRFFDTGRDAITLDIGLTLMATHGDLTIGGTKEAGFLCIRVNPTMNADAGGHMENSYGATDEGGCWSKAAHWVDYWGPVEDETVGFGIFDHPENFRYPTTWHVRGYGLFAPNCWMFKPDHTLPAGDSMTFRWRVVIHTGNTQEAGIRERFLDYVDGPRGRWE